MRGPTTRAGTNRTFKKTLEMGCDTIPCYIPKYGDVSDVHLRMRPSLTPDKGAILEQVDVMQLGKSVNFCVAPFDGAPLAGLAMIARYLLRKTKQISYLTTYAESFDTKSAVAEEVLSGATKVEGRH